MGYLEYLLLGIIFGFLMEHWGKYIDLEFNLWERLAMWVFWLVLLIAVMCYFLRGFFRK